MQVGETFAAAYQSIRANALRSMLTMLGIIIGVGAVITMVALGSGAQKAVEDRIAALGANVFSVYAGQARFGGIRITDRTILSMDDWRALKRDATLLQEVVPEMQQSFQVKYGNQNSNLNIVGTTPEYVEVKNYTLPYGRMFSAGEGEARQRYAVLGASVPRMLGANPAGMIGQTIGIRGITFEIIGVLSEKGAAGGFGNPDEQILVPLETARYRLTGQRPAPLHVGQGEGRRADPAGDGGPGAGHAPGAQDPAGRRERLHHPQPAGHPQHPAGGDRRCSPRCSPASRP